MSCTQANKQLSEDSGGRARLADALYASRALHNRVHPVPAHEQGDWCTQLRRGRHRAERGRRQAGVFVFGKHQCARLQRKCKLSNHPCGSTSLSSFTKARNHQAPGSWGRASAAHQTSTRAKVWVAHLTKGCPASQRRSKWSDCSPPLSPDACHDKKRILRGRKSGTSQCSSSDNAIREEPPQSMPRKLCRQAAADHYSVGSSRFVLGAAFASYIVLTGMLIRDPLRESRYTRMEASYF